MAKRGRPSKLNKQLLELVTRLHDSGTSGNEIALVLGVSPATISRALKGLRSKKKERRRPAPDQTIQDDISENRGRGRPRKLTDEYISQAAEMRRQGMSSAEIGREIGVHRSTIDRALAKYHPLGGMKGEPPPNQPIDVVQDKTDIDGTVDILKLERPATVKELMKLCKLDPEVWIPQYFKPNTWQGFYKIKDGGGHQKVQLFQSKLALKRVVTEDLQDAILRFTRKHVKPLPKPKLKAPRKKDDREPFAVSWGLWDAHIGMYAWQAEVGSDFDVNIAVNRIANSIDDIIEELRFYNIKKIFMPVGNDFLHFDSVKHTTTMGDHFLDTDTRYARVYEAGLSVLSYMVERALEICDDLEIFYVPGNHDYTSSYCLTSALSQRYRHDRRVRVDLGPSPRKYKVWNGILIGFEHGKGVKAERWNTIFATEAHKEWSSSTYREVQIGHTHQRRETVYQGVIPTNGILVRVNPTLCNQDSWHYGNGFIGEPVKSVEVWRYDKYSYRGSHVAYARDEENSNFSF